MSHPDATASGSAAEAEPESADGATDGISSKPLPSALSPFPYGNALVDQVRIVGAALRNFEPGWWPDFIPGPAPPNPIRYLESIFGPLEEWTSTKAMSELGILDPSRLGRTLGYLFEITVPAFDDVAPSFLRRILPGELEDLFFRPTEVFDFDEGAGDFPRERFVYINGVATDREVAMINARMWVRLFGRPIRVIHNATTSLGLDLLESAIGKGFEIAPDPEDGGTFTAPGLVATTEILGILAEREVDRVVVLAHSQGTIIVANVLRALLRALDRVERRVGAGTTEPMPEPMVRELSREVADYFTVRMPDDERCRGLREGLAEAVARFVEPVDGIGPWERVERLEIYTFANAADRMSHLFRRQGRAFPYLEHFANGLDLVAHLGILSPFANGPEGLIRIDGPLYLRPGMPPKRRDALGHLLNAHHLLDIEAHLRGEAPDPFPPHPESFPGPASIRRPRLYGYFGGQTPNKL